MEPLSWREAVGAAVNHFDAYLVTHPFSIERALMFFNSTKHNNGRLARWAIQLQPYTFHIRYRPGKENDNADVLSRMYEEEEDLPLPRPSANNGVGEMSCGSLPDMESEEKRQDKRESQRTRERQREKKQRELLTSC